MPRFVRANNWEIIMGEKLHYQIHFDITHYVQGWPDHGLTRKGNGSVTGLDPFPQIMARTN